MCAQQGKSFGKYCKDSQELCSACWEVNFFFSAVSFCLSYVRCLDLQVECVYGSN